MVLPQVKDPYSLNRLKLGVTVALNGTVVAVESC